MANAIPVHAPAEKPAKKPLSKDAQKIKQELAQTPDPVETHDPVGPVAEAGVTVLPDGTVRKDN